MKVALYHHLPPGGALRSVTEVVRRFPPEVTCDVFTLDTSAVWPFGEPGQDTSLPGTVHRQAVAPLHWDRLDRTLPVVMAGLRRAEREVARIINAGGYDVALVHPCWLTQTPQLLRHLRLPTVYYMHEPRRATFEASYRPIRTSVRPQQIPRRVVSAWLERRLRKDDLEAAAFPDLVLCNSYYSAESIKRAYGIDATVSYLGVDEERFFPDTAASRDDAVLVVGGFETFKRHELVVEAIGTLPTEQRPRLRLVYERVDDDYRREVRRAAAARGVELEEHQGADDSSLAELYRTSRATVLAADLEPFGLSMLESLASGTPLVAVREGGYREVVRHGSNGLLVDRSPTALGRALAEIARPGAVDDATAIRGSLIPFWTWTEAARRQVAALRTVAATVRRR